jgi:hypothetical protein
MSLEELEQRVRKLADPDTNLALAERELRESPLYRNRLMGPHGDTTAMQLIFRRPPDLNSYIDPSLSTRLALIIHDNPGWGRLDLMSFHLEVHM